MTSSTSAAGAASWSASARNVRTASARPDRVRAAGRGRTAIPAASTSPSTRLSQKMARQSATARTAAPASGPEHGAGLLHRADDAERERAALGRPPVGDQRERGRHETAGADALQARGRGRPARARPRSR